MYSIIVIKYKKLQVVLFKKMEPLNLKYSN